MSIKIFRKNNINVFEDNFSIEQLLSASKVWLTSSTKGMAEVTDVYSENHSIESENTLFNKCEDIFRTAFFND
jgi:branched-subunit amino acid aminotransferase/4-amino-4-deoxychorismate lyase